MLYIPDSLRFTFSKFRKKFNHRLKIKNYRTNIMSHCTYNKQDY